MRMMIDIPEELVTDIKDYCGMSMTDAKKALPTILNAIHNGIPLEQIRDEIEQLYTVDTVYEDVVAVDKTDVLQIINKYRGNANDNN